MAGHDGVDRPAPPALTLQDRLDLQDLVQRYAHRVDGREFAGVAELFTPAAVLVAPDPPDRLGPTRELHGPAAIAAELSQLTGFETTSHALLGHVLEPGEDPDTARGHVRCEAHHVSTHPRDGSVRDLVWLLRYADTYRRTDAGWRFARREITVDVVDLRTVKRVNPRPA